MAPESCVCQMPGPVTHPFGPSKRTLSGPMPPSVTCIAPIVVGFDQVWPPSLVIVRRSEQALLTHVLPTAHPCVLVLKATALKNVRWAGSDTGRLAVGEGTGILMGEGVAVGVGDTVGVALHAARDNAARHAVPKGRPLTFVQTVAET